MARTLPRSINALRGPVPSPSNPRLKHKPTASQCPCVLSGTRASIHGADGESATAGFAWAREGGLARQNLNRPPREAGLVAVAVGARQGPGRRYHQPEDCEAVMFC
ncbi:hypothetical protein E4U23_004022 [Claviceps purpurea]|nr:hypothetical protein E4U23_004022 [Claviceps purpurea]